MISGQHNLNTGPPLNSRSPERATHTLFYHCYGETRVIRRTVGGKAVFRDFRRVELSNAMSFYKEDQKSPFTNLPWESGSLRFKFILGSSSRSPWEDFASQRKVHGVIGICHCPHSPDIAEAYEDFMAACRAYPSAQARRCFAFDPSDAQVEQDDKQKKHLILFPWADPAKLSFLLATILQDFAADLLMGLESWVVLADRVGATFTTRLDSPAQLSAEEVSKSTKRRKGRMQKSVGDYCQLAGSPRDAHDHYLSAIEMARGCGDHFWHAGALEGMVSAIVADTEERSAQLEALVREKYAEVVQLYRRAPAPLFELEATLKLAKFLCRREHRVEVAELLAAAVEASTQLLNPSDKLVLFAEVARIYGILGYHRKAVFLARQVALMYQQQDSRYAAISALQLLHLTAPVYCPPGEALVRPPRASLGEWSRLQIEVLSEVLAVAVRAGEPLSAWTAAAQLLRRHHHLLTATGQCALAAALKAAGDRLATGTRGTDPVLPYVRLAGFPQLANPTEVVKRASGKKEWWTAAAASGPFIYTPFASEGEAKAEQLWVEGEVAQVTVELSNPCAFELVIESISLSVSAPFEAFPLSLALPANTPSQMIILGGVPRAAGPLAIRGCFVRCFGVLVEHRFAAKREEREAGAAEDLADPFRGNKEEAPKLEVLVLPPLPLLVAELQGGEGAPVLFEGEVREVALRLTNVGAVALTSAHLGLAGKQREQVRSIGHALLQAALPLPPGASVEVPIVFQGHFCGKEDICALLTVHYAGEEGGGAEAAEPPPGRRLSLPLQLHVQRGLFLVRARLLAMGGGRSSDTATPGKLYRPPSLSQEQVEVEVAVREGKGLRLLELELWNGTDVGFRVGTTIVDGGGEEEVGDGEEQMMRIDRECSARVLIPVEPLTPAAQEGPDVRSSSGGGGGEEKQFVLRNPTWTAAQTKAAALVERAVEDLCARVRVAWKSGRNSRGQLLIRDAVREALQGAAMEIMLPDVITFHFRFRGGANEVAPSGGHMRVVALKVTEVELVVRSRVERAMPLRVSVSCESVTGTHCLGTEGGASNVLWAGSVNGLEMAVPANGAATHTFSLCFLVPGEYSILASALVPSHCLEDAGEVALPPTDTVPQTCCRGAPHKVYVEAR